MKKVNKNGFIDVARSLLYSIIISFGLILIFALILKISNIKESVNNFVFAGIKTVSILIGTFLGFKENKNGMVKGAVSGLLYILLSFLIFALISGFKNVELTWFDVLTGIIAGLISGIITVNIKKNN